MTKEEVIKYWLDSAEMDFQAMESLFSNGHYVWSLFVGHLVLEKTLKACYVKNVDINIPKIHHLLKLAEDAKLELTEDEESFLLEVTTFNMAARYPDFKNRFYKKATRSFAEKFINSIREFRIWLIKKTNS